jgi:Ca2+-binding RTX toxin-like protein
MTTTADTSGEVAYIPVVGQSMVDAWFRYPSVLDAFKDEFLKLRPEYSDVVFYDAARGGSATTQAAALMSANNRYAPGTDNYNAVMNNYWVNDNLTDGHDLQLYLPGLTSWAQGKDIFGVIFDLGETDSTWMNSPDRLTEQNAATEYLLSRIEDAIGATTFYVQAVGDRSFYKQSLDSGTDPMHAFQQAFAEAHGDFRLATETYDLPTADSIHLTEDGFIQAAIRMADAMALGTTTTTEAFAATAVGGKIYVSLDVSPGQHLSDLESTDAFKLIAADGSEIAISSVAVDTQSNVLVITPSASAAGATLEYASATYSFNLGHDDFLYAGDDPVHPFTVALGTAHQTVAASASGDGYTIKDDNGSHPVQGFAANDHLYGYGGNDKLDGGAGTNALYGGTGNDTYYLENSTTGVHENTGEGTDLWLLRSATCFATMSRI